MSALKFNAPRKNEPGLVALSWEGKPGRSYRVEYSEDLREGFRALVSDLADPSLQNQVEDGGPTGGVFRAYRIVLEAAP